MELVIEDIGIFSFKESFFILEKILAGQILSANKDISFLTIKNLLEIKKKKELPNTTKLFWMILNNHRIFFKFLWIIKKSKSIIKTE